MLVFLMIIGAILLRLVPHLPNFAPVAAMGLFSGAHLSRKQAIFVPLIAMAVSDYLLLYINPYQTDLSKFHPVTAMFHSTTLYVWGSVLLISLLGLILKKYFSYFNIFRFSVIGSVLFFIITNFGVWAGGYYGPGLAGLRESYVMAIPFFKYTLLGDLFYNGVFFGSFALAQRFSLKQKKENRSFTQ